MAKAKKKSSSRKPAKSAAKKKAAPKKKTVAKKKAAPKKKAVAKKKAAPKKKAAAKKPVKPVPKKMTAKRPKSYSASDLENFRKLIVEQRTEAQEEFNTLSEQAQDTTGEYDMEVSPHSIHMAEQGTDAMEREKSFLHAQRTGDYIKKLDEALERIKVGTYGVCTVCTELIEKERLVAVPVTQKHVDCKNKTNVRSVMMEEGARDWSSELDMKAD